MRPISMMKFWQLKPVKVEAVSVNLRSNFLQVTDKDGVIHSYNTDTILHYHVD